MVKFSWSRSVKSRFSPEQYESFVTGLKDLYKTKLLAIEKAYSYHYFHSPQLDDVDFEAKPMIMFVGQYSTGKTTLIKHLLKSDFPGIRIGPEPTTDKFISVMYGNSERIIPGNALVVDPKKQYRPLSRFGNAFLNKLQCSTVNSDVLKNLTIIDTPGILSGEKQRVNRGYDFDGVLKWFAERVDRMILLFDAHKLDISDEFKRCIEALQGHDDKIRIVLNKSDMVDQQQLMRVYGALMWSLGKIINTPEITRVYIGSFWSQRLQHDECKKLFEMEQQDLLKDLMCLPKNSAVRKLNDFIKRARLAKVHALIIGTLHRNMPIIFGRAKKKNDLISSLENIFQEIQLSYNISSGDFPDCKKMQEQLRTFDFTKLHHLNDILLDDVDKILDDDIAKLMDTLDLSEDSANTEPIITGGVFDIVRDTDNPFGFSQIEGINAGFGENDWIVNKQREKYDSIFKNLKSDDGKISLRVAKNEMIKSQLPDSVLAEIWKLSDVDGDNSLNIDEFALAMYLIDVKLNGYDLPRTLPKHLLPPKKQQTTAPVSICKISCKN